MNRKSIIWFIIIAFFIGAVGNITLGRFVFPYLSNFRGFAWLSKFTTNAPIVINRTEEVQLNEGVNLVDLIKQSGNITVSIFDQAQNFLGNGIIMTSDGLIFSSSAAIGNHTLLNVVTNDGQKFPGTIKAIEKNGLVALTIPASGLPIVQLNNAADLQPGHRVIYMGRGNVKFEHAATPGFVTQSLSNQLVTKQISTDAAFTSDYFGGPIINLSGNLVGIVINNTENIISEELQKSLTLYLTR